MRHIHRTCPMCRSGRPLRSDRRLQPASERGTDNEQFRRRERPVRFAESRLECRWVSETTSTCPVADDALSAERPATGRRVDQLRTMSWMWGRRCCDRLRGREGYAAVITGPFPINDVGPRHNLLHRHVRAERDVINQLPHRLVTGGGDSQRAQRLGQCMGRIEWLPRPWQALIEVSSDNRPTSADRLGNGRGTHRRHARRSEARPTRSIRSRRSRHRRHPRQARRVTLAQPPDLRPRQPDGQVVLNILATFAEFEVDLIRMRTREKCHRQAHGKLQVVSRSCRRCSSVN